MCIYLNHLSIPRRTRYNGTPPIFYHLDKDRELKVFLLKEKKNLFLLRICPVYLVTFVGGREISCSFAAARRLKLGGFIVLFFAYFDFFSDIKRIQYPVGIGIARSRPRCPPGSGNPPDHQTTMPHPGCTHSWKTAR